MSYYITLKNSKSKPKSNRVIKIQKKIQIILFLFILFFYIKKITIYHRTSYSIHTCTKVHTYQKVL